jgi:hypothetical protein
VKDPGQFTLVGLVLRILALKMQEQVAKARRHNLRAELMRRLPDNVCQVVAGWRVRKHWQNPHFRSAAEVPGKWAVSIRRPEVGSKERAL